MENDLSDEELKNICSKSSNEVLAAHVVVYRHLGIQKQTAIICMEELSFRKNNGSDFNYEEYINEQLKQMPPIQLSQQNRNLLFSILKTK